MAALIYNIKGEKSACSRVSLRNEVCAAGFSKMTLLSLQALRVILSGFHRRTALKRQRENRFARFAN